MSYSKVLSPATLTSTLVNYIIQLEHRFSTVVILPPGDIWECLDIIYSCPSLEWGMTLLSGG